MGDFSKEYDYTTVEGLKEALVKVCDKKVAETISAGFVFDGRGFSLSPEARENWRDLYIFRDTIIFPKNIGTLDNLGYDLTLANLGGFLYAGKAVIEAALANCRIKKAQIINCTTLEELQVIQNTL